MIQDILKSILITFSVSGVGALIGWSIDYNPIKIFILFTSIQFIGFWILNTVTGHLRQVKMTKLENERIAEYTKQSVQAECAYCKTMNLIPLRMDIDNDFNCTNCNKPNAVYIGVTVTQKTNPVSADPLAINTLNPDEQAAIDHINRDRI
jgi:hypothetical protein